MRSKTNFSSNSVRGLAQMVKQITLISIGILGLFASMQPAWGIVSQISNCQELQDIAKNNDKDYVIVKDIDCKDFIFIPIPDFQGTLDGQDATIHNLTINADSQAALFRSARNAIIKNLQISDAEIVGGNYTATLIGNASGVTLKNIRVKSKINSQSYSGGIAGTVSPSFVRGTNIIDRPSQLTNIVVELDLISDNGSHIGGIAGTLEGSDLKSCDVSGSVRTNSATGYNGGVAGYLAVAEIGSDAELRSASIAACVSQVDIHTSTHGPYQSTLVGRVIGGKKFPAVIRHSIAIGTLNTPGFQGQLQIGNRIGNTFVD